MERYIVTGMSCAACQARVEKAVSAVPGVDNCTVSLLTNSMAVEGTAASEDIIRAVEEAGYKASYKEEGYDKAGTDDDALKDRETPVLKKRLIASVPILLLLMYFSMGHMMWGFPVPKFLDDHIIIAVIEMVLALAVMAINGRFFTSGISSLMHRAPNMDTLVAMGSGASFVYSAAELILMIIAHMSGDHDAVMRYGMNLYFESAAMIPALITVGKMLEAMSKGHTTDALKGLMKLAPKTAVLIRDGVSVEIGIEEVRTDDIFAVRPGEQIPVDGIIVKGMTAVNESALTGESIPVDKAEGDGVSAGTMNGQGYIECRATRVGEDTTLAQIIRVVSDAAATKAPLGRIADRASAIFVPSVIVLALLTFLGWLLAGRTVAFAVARGISVLVISCPCALGLATPVAIMVGSGVGAKSGILYKTAQALEGAGRTRIIALDKTGTLTEGKPVVTDIIPTGADRDGLLELAASLEKNSEHPLAKAVTDAANGVKLTEVSDFAALPGNGLRAKMNGTEVLGGSLRFMESEMTVDDSVREKVRTLSEQGKTPILFASDKKIAGLMAVADTLKEDSAEAVKELRGMGIYTVMLTGDNEMTAKAISARAGVDHVTAGVLPADKADVIERLKGFGRTTMVGDGINDAPALTAADNGIAIGAGTDVAVDAADIVVMKSRLKDVTAAIRLSRATIRNIHENLFWAFGYNVLCIPLAMGLYGIELKPMYGAAAMALSSFCVCMNALRLNLIDPYDSRHDRAVRDKAEIDPDKISRAAAVTDREIEKPAATTEHGTEKPGTAAIDKSINKSAEHNKAKETETMTKTLKVEGMMCEHCEARVKKALEAIDGVESATADHNANTAVVTLTHDVADDVLSSAVEAQDYKVVGVE